MNKKDIEKDMKQYCGGSFITVTQLQKYMGVKSHHSVEKYLVGLDRISDRYYFVPDVVESLFIYRGVR